MRTPLAILLMSIALLACSKGANEGAEEAKKQAEKEQKEKEASGGVAKKISPPVAGKAKLDCASVINATQFQQVLGETEAITVTDSKSEPDAAASCSILRGGKRLSDAEQKAKLKKEGRLGVMAGDEICNVSTFCWTIEDADRFRQKCHDMKDKDDDTLGFYSCVLIVAQGADDVKRFRFFDDDTKCIIQVRGGPSNVDNDLIGKCAKAAHDLIGPDQIKVGAPPAEAPAAPAEPAAEGSATK
ncbi:MAG TPA: hypothetical protein VFV99_03070 [Kofleriaceae bacterium]|nr:hypothetical protein [Kofleriaceae bacterium]